jgi:ADP-Ribosyltransferase in polyvalent proteins
MGAREALDRLVEYAVTDNPEFLKWFSGSKAIDAQGRPLLVYRGEHGEWSPLARDISDQLLEYAATETETFRRWFDGSKAVDSSGRPLVLYHGTDVPEHFQSFGRTEDIGYHFGTAKQATARTGVSDEVVRDAAKGGGPLPYQNYRRLIPVYLRVRKPLRLDDLNDWTPKHVADALVDADVVTPEEADAVDLVDQAQVKAWLGAKGYDGIVYKNRTEAGGGEDSWLVFDPRQVKSVWASKFNPRSTRYGR